jgi:hypothetical protein
MTMTEHCTQQSTKWNDDATLSQGPGEGMLIETVDTRRHVKMLAELHVERRLGERG